MKTITTQLFSFDELSKDAQDNILQDRIREALSDDMLLEWQSSEMLESLKAISEACGLALANYCFGAYSRTYEVKVRGQSADLQGDRALAWFLRILMNHGYTRPAKFRDMEFPGICGFTGVCYDDDVVDTIWKALLEGDDVVSAFDDVAHVFCKSLESEVEYLTSEESILETLDRSEEIYTENGEVF